MSVIRSTALKALPPGALGSLGFMLYSGRHQKSLILTLLFATWVLSPFIAARAALAVSKQWPELMQALVYTSIIVSTVSSLTVYGAVAFGQLKVKVGFIFLVAPLASWVLLALVVLAAAWQKARKTRGLA